MKVLVVGNGGREHAIIQSLKKSKKIKQLFAIAGNGGIANDATTVDINVKDIEKVTASVQCVVEVGWGEYTVIQKQ